MPNDFKKLQKEWAKKLKDSGFSDTEYLDDNGVYGNLQKPEGPVSMNHPLSGSEPTHQEWFESRRDYFLKAEHFLSDRSWRGKTIEKRVWQLHAEGLSEREILAKIPQLTQHYVHKTITSLKNEMLRKYFG